MHLSAMLGSSSSRRGKEAEDSLRRGLAKMKLPVWRELSDAPCDGPAIPERPSFVGLRDRLAALLDQGAAILLATTRDRIPAMSKGGRGAKDQQSKYGRPVETASHGSLPAKVNSPEIWLRFD